MNQVLAKLNEIQQGQIGIKVYCTRSNGFLDSINPEMTIPLASAAKIAIGYCAAAGVETGELNWNDLVDNISFNPGEDSKELYPHLQLRSSLQLREAVEVMIACHDSYVAGEIVRYCGGWEKVNHTIQAAFPSIHATENPRSQENKGKLDETLNLIIHIYEEYIKKPDIWTPIINGLVRQKGGIDGIPSFHLNHMTGGLDHALVDIGIMGAFGEQPLLFAVGAVNLPNRFHDKTADQKIIEAMKLLYQEYTKH
ncbi:serine hydrolase [Rossellomorea vietnamensis]|uniref:Serine hydrolase n=1 Tax=Rossellomorea vietnamensis TaxID=218284 RepID=A0A5D4P1D8_9BACI|nr:serine hydrolase [Rossellomorea vietnamensis]TYS19821.1 serine hydrolase [Rossellomorea vietnamensis]